MHRPTKKSWTFVGLVRVKRIVQRAIPSVRADFFFFCVLGAVLSCPLLLFLVEVAGSFHGSFPGFHGNVHGFHGSLHVRAEAFMEVLEALMEVLETSMEAVETSTFSIYVETSVEVVSQDDLVLRT